MISRIATLTACLLMLAAPPAMADEESAPAPVVISGKYGSCYARSTPRPPEPGDANSDTRSAGITEVYRVGGDGDEKLARYDWYARRIIVACYEVDGGVALARIGPWPRGHIPSEGHLAIGFYLDGKEVETYSTEEIYDLTEEYIQTISHYMVFGFQSDPKFRWDHVGNRHVFEINDAKNRPITFDPVTGDILSHDGKPVNANDEAP